MDTYGGISHIYLLQLCVWIICCFIDCNYGRAQSRVSSKGHILFIFITFKYIYLKYVHYGPKPKAIISHDWCDVLGLYFSSYGMWKFSTYFEDKKNLESAGINSSQDFLDWFESQMDSNTIYYLKFQTWNLALQLA